MATTRDGVLIVFCCCLYLLSAGTSSSTILRIKNSCSYNTWPAILTKPGSNSPQLNTKSGLFPLRPGESKTVAVPPGWSGSVWGRTLCTYSLQGSSNLLSSCVTGDCGGSSTLECNNSTSSTPLTTTLAVFTSTSTGDGQYIMSYFVSLSKGYNLPMTVAPVGGRGGGRCEASGCVVELIKECPEELRVMYGDVGVGCNVVDCQASEDDEDEDYCSGVTSNSGLFEKSCPLAHSSPNDKISSSSFSCLTADSYDVTFCASSFPTLHSSGGSETQGKKYTLVIKIVGGSIGVVVMIVVLGSCGCAVKLVIRHRRQRVSNISDQTIINTTTTSTHVYFGFTKESSSVGNITTQAANNIINNAVSSLSLGLPLSKESP